MAKKTNWINAEKDLPELDKEVLAKLWMYEDIPPVIYIAKRVRTKSGGWTWEAKNVHNFESFSEIPHEVESWCEIPK